MRAYHNTRKSDWRTPFGAVPAGTEVTVALDVWDDPGASCACRIWVDGEGETVLPMEKQEEEDHFRFSCRIPADEPEILWYSFLIYGSDGYLIHYGAREGKVGGEGCLYVEEPPSFQITVYEPRPLPEWYRTAIVYQIFPDRFHRGTGWRTLADAAVRQEKNGPGKRLVEDWDAVPFYEKTPEGRVRVWDFYGGTLAGIEEKLDYLQELGITALYLNPIFEAASNHRYDTGNYKNIDPMLGDEAAFTRLIGKAAEKGISVFLDGVFNHTGCDSLYFNKYGNYPGLGAWQSEDSPYRSWYRFDNSPIGYDCWWGVDDLPSLEEGEESYRRFVFEDPDSVIRKWLNAGAKGWRLDVADELPDDFIEGIKSAVTETLGADGLLLGEVWEDASHKISYGKLRRYFLGTELDCTMNYPFLDAVHAYLLGWRSAEDFAEEMESLQENYPPSAFYGSLNLVGSHDRPRVMTVLGEAPDKNSLSEEEKRDYRLSPQQRDLAKKRIRLMTLLQMTLPGVPCIYYGDEAGLEGYADPYNRGTYPWGKEDEELKKIYRDAIGVRKTDPVFTDGTFTPFALGADVFGFYRDTPQTHAAVLVNRSLSETRQADLPAKGGQADEIVNGFAVTVENGRASIALPPMSAAVIFFR
ncbi:MAG: glycoside hydrolase family 13 protein [Firmicutes bacterium]|nr:glycoside hydrolase family 13 protein [Bacillota bacterium]